MSSIPTRDGLPAVNVKVPGIRADFMARLPITTDEGTTPEGFEAWIDANVSEAQQDAAWEAACQDGFQAGSDLALEIFGAGVTVYSAGRSGGWLTVDGLGDRDLWTTAERARWDTFTAEIAEIVSDVPRSWLDALHARYYAPAHDIASLILNVSGTITTADGLTRHFMITAGGGWSQWGADRPVMADTRDALDAMATSLGEYLAPEGTHAPLSAG